MARRHLSLLGFVAFELLSVAIPTVALAQGTFEDRRVTAWQLLDAGRFDEALSVYGTRGDEMNRDLLDRIGRDRPRKSPAQKLQLYDGYFRYFPFGQVYWHHQHSRWDKAAVEYVELRKRIGGGRKDERLEEVVAAMQVYQKLVIHHEKYDLGRFQHLADEIVAKFPQSMFCPAAVLSVGHVSEQHHGGASAIPIYEHYLTAMKKAGAPRRSLLLVMLAMAYDCTTYSTRPEQLRQGLELYREIMQETDVNYEKRYCLREMARTLQKLGDPASLAQSRLLFEEFLVKYPDAIEAAGTRVELIEVLDRSQQSDGALASFRKMEKDAQPGTDLDFELYAVAEAYRNASDRDKALRLLEELVERFPKSVRVAPAFVSMAEIYSAMGNEDKMIEAYKNGCGLGNKYTAGSNPRTNQADSRAFHFLGEYYMKKGQWAESLRFWQGWKAHSGCGNCDASIENKRRYNIATCQRKLDRLDDAIATLEPLVLADRAAYAVNVAEMLVDLSRERGTITGLQKKLEEAIAKAKYNQGAQVALEYLKRSR